MILYKSIYNSSGWLETVLAKLCILDNNI